MAPASREAPEWLVVGLGNPGRQYACTPHNLGFLVLDTIAAKSGIRWLPSKALALVGRGPLAGVEVVLAKPQTYMNASGAAVRDLLEHYGIETERLVVITDDIMLPWGTVRIRQQGSAGGHHGLASVIAAVGTDRFVRLRIGIGPLPPGDDLTRYVLRPMDELQRQQAQEGIEQAVAALEWLLRHGPAAAMSRFNRRASAATDAAPASS